MPDFIRFYLDEMVPKAVADGLRARGVECVRTSESGNLAKPDTNQLTFATENELVIFTRDSDFVQMHSEGHKHAGIVYIPQQRRVGLGTIINALCLVHDVLKPEEMINHVEYL